MIKHLDKEQSSTVLFVRKKTCNSMK